MAMNAYSLTDRQTNIPRETLNQATSPALRESTTQAELLRAFGDSAVDSLSSIYRPIQHELSEVEHLLSEELRSPHPDLKNVLRHGTQLGGKRLRPAMLLLFGKASGRITKNHLITATVIEMVHTATLIHDDVLDSADSRRHVPTINAKWNQHTSILVGDYLFSQAYRLAATTSSTQVCEKVGEAARIVCEGELRQVLHRDLLDLDETTYLSMLQAKTGELCRVACELAVELSGGAGQRSRAAADFGNSLGIAFQIADDFLDIWGDPQTVGKTLGTDLLQGKITLPVIFLLQNSDARKREKIRSILLGPPEARVSEILPILEASDAKKYTQSIAELHYNNAIQALEQFDQSEIRQCLEAIAYFSIHRKF